MDSYAEIKSPIVRRMMRNFRLSETAESENRANGLRALKFRQGGQAQWDDKVWSIRQEDNRPTESYNQIPQFVHQVTNDMRMNMPQTRFIPGSDGDKEVAEIYEDLARAIQASSEGEVAYDSACDSQVTIGWGYWRYIMEYESPKTFDQIIKILWVPNAFTVYDDPTCMMQDFSDRKFLIQVCDEERDTFNNSGYSDEKGNRLEYDASELQSIGDSCPGWASDKFIRLAEYWELTEEKTMLYRKGGKITKEKPSSGKYEEREVIIPKVMWYKCTARDVLEKKEWPGIYIPYVRASGETLVIDGKIYYNGLVESMIPAQKQYNYWANGATEMVALAPKAPFILDPDQIAGYEQFWDKANIKNYPWLPARFFGKDGKQYGTPQRANNAADISSMLALVQQAQQNFYTTTGIYPASLGQASNEKSGKAIIARQREGDVSTFHFSDNMARALRFGGRILADLIPKVYDGARSVRLLKEDKSSREVKINQEHTDERGEKKNFDLTVGTYDVMVTTGPSFTTKRQEAAETMTQLAQSTDLMAVGGDIILGNMDFPGADKLAERVKKTLPPNLTEEPKKGDIPPQLQAQVQQMQQLIEQLSTELQAAQGELQSKQADYQLKQADLQVKLQDIQASSQTDAMKAETDRMKLELDAQKMQLEAQKLALEEQKIELEFAKIQVGQIQPESPPQPEPQSKNMLAAQIADMEAREAMEEEAEFARQQEEAAKLDLEAQKSAMLMAQLEGIQGSLNALTSSIMAPKVITRDPQTGMVTGVVNAN